MGTSVPFFVLLADFILRRHADGELHFYCESLIYHSFVFILGIGSHLPAQAEENETKKESECTLHLDGPKKRTPYAVKNCHSLHVPNGEVRFSFPEELEYLRVTIEHAESKTTWTSQVGHEDCMLISTANGTYNISAITESGQHFSGILQVTE